MMQIDDPLDDRHTQTGAAARGTRLIANDKRIKQRFPDRVKAQTRRFPVRYISPPDTL